MVSYRSTSYIGFSINVENPMYQKGRRYYVVTGVMLTNSISVTALDESAKTINVELGSIV
jgi:hypothetical protein